MKSANSSRNQLLQRLCWIFLALAVLVFCGYMNVNHVLQELPQLWRIILLTAGWGLALLLMLKALSIKFEQHDEKIEAPAFPSPELTKIKDAQEGLQIGFVALDSHARIVLANAALERVLDLREASSSGGLARVFHPDAAHLFRNTFQEICQTPSGTTTLKLRSFDRMQQLHHLQVALMRWKEPPVAAIAILWDMTEQEQSKQELQIATAALHDLHGVFAGETSNLLDTMRALLDLGRLHFRAELGMVARFKDATSPLLEVIQIVSSHEQLARGEHFDPTSPSHSNYPRVLSHAAFAFTHDESSPPPVFKATRQDTFLGAPLYVKGQLYGVLCFASPENRPEGFFVTELELVQFMANWLSQEMERRQIIEEFESRQHHLTEINSSLENLLRDDLLTGLSNKMALDDRLEEEFTRARHFGTSLSVIALAPDPIRQIRQQYGDAAWQQTLEQLANLIDEHIRSFDIAARYEDSTFVIVLPQTDAKAVQARLESLRAEVAQTPFPHQNIHINAGLVTLDEQCQHSQQLLKRALEGCQLAQMHAVS